MHETKPRSLFTSLAHISIGTISGCLFWVLVQRLSPQLSNWVLDIYVVPMALSAALGAAVTITSKKWALCAISFTIGTIAMATSYTIIVVYGSSPSMY